MDGTDDHVHHVSSVDPDSVIPSLSNLHSDTAPLIDTNNSAVREILGESVNETAQTQVWVGRTCSAWGDDEPEEEPDIGGLWAEGLGFEYEYEWATEEYADEYAAISVWDEISQLFETMGRALGASNTALETKFKPCLIRLHVSQGMTSLKRTLHISVCLHSKLRHICLTVPSQSFLLPSLMRISTHGRRFKAVWPSCLVYNRSCTTAVQTRVSVMSAPMLPSTPVCTVKKGAIGQVVNLNPASSTFLSPHASRPSSPISHQRCLWSIVPKVISPRTVSSPTSWTLMITGTLH